MDGYEKAQYLSQCYQNNRLTFIGICVVITVVASLLYFRRKKEKVKGKKKQAQRALVLQKHLAVIGLLGLSSVLSIILILPIWKDNRQSSFSCVTGIYERDFPPVNWHQHPIIITDDEGGEISLHVATGYLSKEGFFSSLVADEAFPEGCFRARVYYGEHSRLAFYMERLP